MTTTRSQHQVAVIGAGLTGLSIAAQLHRVGLDVVVLEAQSRVGGRVYSVTLPDEAGRLGGTYDLGPTWYWPSNNPRMVQLLTQHGLESFAQHDAGALLYELADGSVHRVGGASADDGARRVVGGMRAIVDALANEIPRSCQRTDQRLVGVERHSHGVELRIANANGAEHFIAADYVISTLPLRLLASTVSFRPELPTEVLTSWSDVPTWMAAHAKFLAVYDTAFWRKAALSGHVRSQRGPLVEIHDAGANHGLPALFGFLGVPAGARAAAGDRAICQSALAQLQRLFGPSAATPVVSYYKDWTTDAFTATAADRVAPLAHPDYGAHVPLPAPWAERFVVSGTETAQSQGGYLEGALEAAAAAVAQVLGRAPLPTQHAPPSETS